MDLRQRLRPYAGNLIFTHIILVVMIYLCYQHPGGYDFLFVGWSLFCCGVVWHSILRQR